MTGCQGNLYAVPAYFHCTCFETYRCQITWPGGVKCVPEILVTCKGACPPTWVRIFAARAVRSPQSRRRVAVRASLYRRLLVFSLRWCAGTAPTVQPRKIQKVDPFESTTSSRTKINPRCRIVNFLYFACFLPVRFQPAENLR
ncbi:uncharacterized protein PGTG_02351 [Puccinia graminis f. sp. tritici CRL 75-36-700-3]|uniref:Uncharacterized protein n=1 Tax=Puccinia graminis f. sp. tritici (strain CRL 75-36-700-3 / race SCCL) TaxID=418459 RepID=E3JXW5_PUCGT|nr:uncharacterized protein PGTG_02351 [Puccinia graminis f. sp. tritici CRL 75-36-700-3]EFP76890.1 hypothetical protein PGTG_02351 [Puccinia graminis f. sp. tritici CRL 75-36-700-3]